MFCFGRIYDGKQRVMKPSEIFTVSVKAYCPREENGVSWKYLLKTGCCLLSSALLLCHWDSEQWGQCRSIERHQGWNKGAIQWECPMFWLFHRSVSPTVHCLITSLWSITFTVQLMWHPPLFKVYTGPCEHQDDLYSPCRSRDFVRCTWHFLASKSMTGHLLEYNHFMV